MVNVIKWILIKKDFDLLHKCGCLKKDSIRLCSELSNILNEQNENYSEYFKNEEETIVEKISNK